MLESSLESSSISLKLLLPNNEDTKLLLLRQIGTPSIFQPFASMKNPQVFCQLFQKPEQKATHNSKKFLKRKKTQKPSQNIYVIEILFMTRSD